MKVSELTGAQLDYWVAKAEGLSPEIATFFYQNIEGKQYPIDPPKEICIVHGVAVHFNPGATLCFSPPHIDYSPSTNWAQGGPIIDRYSIVIGRRGKAFGRVWATGVSDENGFSTPTNIGSTPLIAAMRAYVASVYGEEIPDEATSA